jgi:hypothetical protein
VGPEALGLEAGRGGLGGDAGQGREESRELCERLVAERPQFGSLERTRVVVEGVDHDRERDLTLELGRAALEDEVAARRCPPGELREEA